MKQTSKILAWSTARNKRLSCVASYKKERKKVIATLMISISLYLFVSILFGNNGLMVYFQRKTEKQEYKKEIHVLSQEIDEAKQEIDAINNGGYLFEFEQRARELGLTYRDELIYKFNALAPDENLEPERSHNEKE